VSAPLRVGRIAALNMHPVYHHLELAASEETLSYLDGVPTELNAAVLDGRLDVSAMSSIEYARHAHALHLLPVASIAAEGAVDSIQLFSRVPLETVRSVAVTPHSATTVALLRILLGPGPRFTRLLEAPDAALAAYDGVLLIGDEALEGLRTPFAAHHRDLSAMWRERTGLPMVFAVWAARADVARRRPREVAALEELLRQAQRRWADDPEGVVAAAARRFPFPADYIGAYLMRLRFGFGPAERAGLARFLELARAAGELDAVPSLAA
jgi:chorismate dehydratase